MVVAGVHATRCTRARPAASRCSGAPATRQGVLARSGAASPSLRQRWRAERGGRPTEASSPRPAVLRSGSSREHSCASSARGPTLRGDSSSAPKGLLSLLALGAWSAYLFGAAPGACLAETTATTALEAERATAEGAQALYQLAALDASSAAFVASALKPAIGVASLFMIVRIVLTWFPETKSKEFPWLIFYYTTEPVLRYTRAVFQPVGGVDISPIIWVSFLSFMNEILVGPQGILILLQNKS